ncbi:MAG TPA: hypothetical protein VGD40_25600 [Chryseosolibacter sp.]
MKRIIGFAFICLLQFGLCSATIHTVCNMPYSPGMYTTFNDAQAAAIDGDTIYMHASSISYGDIQVIRRLVIIGTGHKPDKPNGLYSSFHGIVVTAPFVQLIGLTISYVSSDTQFVTIRKCRIIGSSSGATAAIMSHWSGDDWLIEGNIFDLSSGLPAVDFHGWPANNCVIRNNIFSGPGVKIRYAGNSGPQQIYLLNNIFLSNNTSQTFEFVQRAVINNNIFVSSDPVAGLADSEMNNNISFACLTDFNQPGSNNLDDVDPLFTNFPGPGTFFSYTHNYSLMAGSPGHNSGTDGTDRGLFGGIGSIFTMTGEPSIATVTAFTITSPTTIAPNGTLTISVTSKRVH